MSTGSAEQRQSPGLLGRALSRRSADASPGSGLRATASRAVSGRQTSSVDGAPPDVEDGDQLPTYEELRRKEPGRFGRWRGWIEKRGREQQAARSEARQRAAIEGRPTGSSWNLEGGRDGVDQAESPGPDQDNESSLLSAGAERQAFENATQPRRDAHGDSGLRGRAVQPSLEPGPGEIRLTPSASIHPIGSRFLAQFTSRPLCAVPLPVAPAKKARYTAGKNVERFLLVGTAEGLFVCDLIPALSHPVNVQTISSSDSRVYQLWKGVGVHQLDIAIDDTPDAAAATSVPGLLVALVTQDSNSSAYDGTIASQKEMRMWPLQASECLDLRQHSSRTVRRQSTITSASSHAYSAYTGVMGLIDKGESRAPGLVDSISRSVSRRRRVPSNASETTFRTSPEAGLRGVAPIATSALDTTRSDPVEPSSAISPTDGLTDGQGANLPKQWASAYVALAFPRIAAQGPILFMRLSKAPTPSTTDADRWDEEELPQGLRRSSTMPRSSTRSTLYLIVATKQVVFLLQSSPEARRTWQLYKEMATPFTPKVASLTLSEFRTTIRRSSTSMSTHERFDSIGRPPAKLERSLAVALAMKDHGVLIRVSDLSVKELETPGSITSPPRTGSMGSRSSRRSLLRQQDETVLGHLSRASMTSAEALIRPRAGRSPSISSGGFEVESRRPKVSHERRWTGIEEFLIPTRRKRGAGMVATCLCTRGHFTYVTLSPLGIDDRPQTSINGGPTPLTLRPLYTFTWRGCPTKVRARFVETPPAWSEGFRSDDLFCCITAFTATGIETHEGFVSMDHVASLARDPTAPKHPGSLFRPAASSRPSESSSSAAPASASDGEVDTSSYDFGSEIGWLCSGGPWFGGQSGWSDLERQTSDASAHSDLSGEVTELSAWKEAEDLSNRGDFFFRSAVGDHRLLWIGSGSLQA